jgi:hypothetical protein
MFVTCLYVLLAPVNGQLRYTNAGHALTFEQTVANAKATA